MKSVTMNLNTAATALAAGAAKVRTQIKDGKVQIRFTDRVDFRPNPEQGVFLRKLSKKNKTTSKFTFKVQEEEVGKLMALVPGKYGWFTLEAIEQLTDGQPAIRISEK